MRLVGCVQVHSERASNIFRGVGCRTGNCSNSVKLEPIMIRHDMT